MINRDDWKFFVTNLDDKTAKEFGLPEDNCGILYALYLPENKTFWYDNYNLEWQGSIYPASEIINDPDFEEVSDEWDNGYITVDEAIDGTAPQCLDCYFPSNQSELAE